MEEVYSVWSNNIYPCTECDYVGELDAFKHGQCYRPCPKCGGKRKRRTGRFVYSVEKNKYLSFIKTKKFKKVEWKRGG